MEMIQKVVKFTKQPGCFPYVRSINEDTIASLKHVMTRLAALLRYLYQIHSFPQPSLWRSKQLISVIF